jgi:nucleotide-binding universal stress UspA family protein
MTETKSSALPFQTIVVGTDFSECSGQALEMAAQLTLAAPKGRLHVVHTFELPVYPGAEFYTIDMFTPTKQAADEQMERVIAKLKQRGIDAQSVVSCGPAWDCIVQTAEAQHADLVVVGTHGRSGVRRALLGSVAEKVVRTSTVPVLTVRGKLSEG